MNKLMETLKMKLNGSTLITLALALGVVFYLFASNSNDPNKTISAKDAYSLMTSDSSVVVLDVRTVGEYQSGHIKNSLLIPLQELNNRLNELKTKKEKKILVFCRSGNRSGQAQKILEQNGYNAVNISGGVISWSNNGLPLE